MAIMEVCSASRFSLYLCVFLYTLSVYTHMIMLMHGLCLGKEILIFQSSSYFDVCV